MPINTAIPATPIQADDPQPVKRDFDNLDSLLGELSQPKQTFEQPELVQQPSAMPWNIPGSEPLTEEEANRSGKRLAKTIDSTFSFLAGLYAKSEDVSKYKATPGEIDDLADPLTEISQKYNFAISPEWRAIFLLITIYGPRAILAVNDRRINQLEDRVQKIEDQIRIKEDELKEKEKNSDADQVK